MDYGQESLCVKEEIREFNIRFLGTIEFDTRLESSFGDAHKLLNTDFAQHIKKIASLPIFY